MLLNNILEAIGNTPLIQLNKIGANIACNLYGKCEFLNPGGSVKDRIALRMLEEAEKKGQIKPGDTLIEPTSGNTGIGIALAGAVKGYQVIITMPEKMSHEKQVVLEALGAKIIRTPTEAPWNSPQSHIGVAHKLQKELPNAFILDQYGNRDNPLAHYYGTGNEIIEDLCGRVDMLVIGAGTGGTLTGCAKRIKEHNPSCIVVGVDPIGSILAGDEEIKSYKVEGIGYDFVPEVLDRSLVDVWVKTNDRQSFLLARRLIREESLLCGGSSGAAIFAALKEAPRLHKNQNCVVLLADGVRNYLTKFVDDKWMKDNRFVNHDGIKGTVSEFDDKIKRQKVVTIASTDKISRAISLMRDNGFSQLPVTHNEELIGMLYEKDLLEYLMSSYDMNEEVIRIIEVMSRNYATVHDLTPLCALQELLLTANSVILIDEERRPKRVITKIDLVEWMSKKTSIN